MTIKSRTGCMIIALLLCGAAPALAQTTPPEHVPLQKTIGQAGPEVVPSLIVMNARGASLQGGKLTLTGVAPNSIVFATARCGRQGIRSRLICCTNGRRAMIAQTALARIRRTPPSRCSARTGRKSAMPSWC